MNRRRVTFELDEKTVSQIEKIANSGNAYATTMKDVVRHALGLYFRAVDAAQNGGHVIIDDGESKKEILVIEVI